MKTNQQFDKAFERVIIWALILFSYSTFGQQIDRVYKENGVWKGDISGPITTYPKQGVIISDTTAIPDPAPPIQFVNVDNVDPKIVYTPKWTHNGPTTATGFHDNTMAYDATAGKTVTLNFTGTYIEVFCEKKVGHGSAAFQVDSQPVVTIPLGVAGPVGSTSVFKADLPAGNHTFKLTIAGGGNVVFDYVKINGSVVTVPPMGIIVNPGQSIKSAVESAVSGNTVSIMAGTYNEAQINVPVGVNVVGAGKDLVFIDFNGGTTPPGSSDLAVIQLKSGSRTNGNQTISGFTIRGKNTSNGGVTVSNRDNVKVNDIKVQECTFFGFWLQSGTGIEMFNCESFNASWASTGWCSGEINISGLTNSSIHHNYFRSTGQNKGYGIKALWPNTTLTNVKIYSNRSGMAPNSLWNNYQSPNIDIELAATSYAGIEIYDNDLVNMISAAAHKPTVSGRLWIHDNRMTMQSGSTCHVEVVCSNVTIEKNILRGAPIVTANFQPNGRWNDIIVDGNDFVSNNANPSWGGTFLIGPDGVTNFVYKNNKITKGSYPIVKYMGVTGGVSDGGGNIIN